MKIKTRNNKYYLSIVGPWAWHKGEDSDVKQYGWVLVRRARRDRRATSK